MAARRERPGGRFRPTKGSRCLYDNAKVLAGTAQVVHPEGPVTPPHTPSDPEIPQQHRAERPR